MVKLSSSATKIEILRFAALPVVLKASRKGQRKQVLDILIKATPAFAGDMPEALVSIGGLAAVRGNIQLNPQGMGHLQLPIEVLSDPTPAHLQVRWQNESREADSTLQPPKKWKVYIGAGSHTDNGFNFIQPEAQEVHIQNTLKAVEYAERYKDLPFVWNMEVAWHAELVEKKHPRIMKQLVQSIKDGRISLQGAYMNVLTHIMHPELLNRLFYTAHAYSRRFGFPIECAIINDIPSLCGMFPAVLRGSGIRYFVSGVNTARGCGMGDLLLGKPRQWPTNFAFSPLPRVWEGLDGSEVTTQYTYSYIGPSVFVLGLTASLEHAQRQVGGPLLDPSMDEVPGNEIYCQGAYPDNCGLTKSFPQTLQQWNDLFETPQFVMCRPQDFMKRMEKRHGKALEHIRGDGGAYWEDGACSSARETGQARVAACRLFILEKALALASIGDPKTTWPVKALQPAYDNLMLWAEHTWGANCSTKQPRSAFTRTQWGIKAGYAHDFVDAVADIEEIARKGLRKMVNASKSELALFNGLSWQRDTVVSVKLGKGECLIDSSTGEIIPQANGLNGTLQFHAKDVPSMGCKVLTIAEGTAKRSERFAGTCLENDFYKLEVDPKTAGVRSLLDKQNNKELVDRSASPFGQCLYVSGGENSDMVAHYPGLGKEPVRLTEHKPKVAKISARKNGTLSQTITIDSSVEMLPKIQTEITLYNALKRIDISQRLVKRETFANEALYVAFPFLCRKPQVFLETPSAWMEPNKDQLAGGCREWYSAQHAVYIKDGDYGIAWSAPDSPLVCLEDINRGKWLTDLPILKGHLYAYLMNNYWNTNFKASQGGKFLFRFSLTSGKGLSQLGALQFGWGVCNPLLEARGTGKRAAGESTETASISVAEPEIIVEGCKKAEFSDAIMVRLWETSGERSKATLSIPPQIQSAHLCNLVEEPERELRIKNGRITVPIRPKGLATVLLAK